MSHITVNGGQAIDLKYHDTKESFLTSLMYGSNDSNQPTFNVILNGGLGRKIKIQKIEREDQSGKNFRFEGFIIQTIMPVSGNRTNESNKVSGFIAFPKDV